MEFYCFWRRFRGYARKVSIPNGMEFYRIGSLENPAGIWVSIPNGMEFYCH